jgi:hypothetical protein
MSGVCGLRPAHQMPACAVDPMGGLEDQQADRKGQQKSCWIEASPASTAAVLGEYENCSIWFVLSAALCLSSIEDTSKQRRGWLWPPWIAKAPLQNCGAIDQDQAGKARLHAQFPQILALQRLHPPILKSVSHHHLVLVVFSNSKDECRWRVAVTPRFQCLPSISSSPCQMSDAGCHILQGS